MDLQKLHDKLIAEGCSTSNFHIEGIGPLGSDVFCLGEEFGVWEVFYSERGTKGEVLFSNPIKERAIQFFYDYILRIDHWHLITFTRSEELFHTYKKRLSDAGIKTIQNDIPHYSHHEDRIYRLFVVNKDIFKARKIFGTLPHIDQSLKR